MLIDGQEAVGAVEALILQVVGDECTHVDAREAGEVQGKVKKMLRDGTFNKDAIAAEIGDVLWYIAALCRDLEIDMAEVALKNLSKLKSRQERGTIQGSGDNR